MQHTAAAIGAAPTRIIVLGNEKGGTGKSTTAMHVVAGLMYAGHRVTVLDLDARQGTLSRYLENRRRFAEELSRSGGGAIPVPEAGAILRSGLRDRAEAEAEERHTFADAVSELSRGADYLVIDTPGADTALSRIAHSHADILITPLNDSFIDLDMLARVDRDSLEVLEPSTYAELVWQQRRARAAAGARPVDWVVMRNRMGHQDARLKRDMGQILARLATRIGFRIAPGFGERLIFRELFLKGLTVLDLAAIDGGGGLTMSHLAARQEVRALLEALDLPDPLAA